MTLFNTTLKWLVSLTAVFFKNAPIATTVVVIATLISQLTMMMAFLMPLKIVMLLSSEGIPRFFPRALIAFDRDALVLSLVALSISAYIISMLMRKISDTMTERGIKRLQDKTQKIVIFDNQDTLASTAYKKYTNALAGFIFAVITIAALLMFYQDVGLLLTGFLTISGIIIYFLYISSTRHEHAINENTQAICTSLANVGFLLTFLYIVADFLYLTPPTFIIALVTIILGRLMLMRLGVAVANFFSLRQDKDKINTLFFHNHAFIPTVSNRNRTAWDMLSPGLNMSWVKPLLEDATNQNLTESVIKTQWQETRIKKIIVLQAEIEDSGKTFLIKLYERKGSAQAQHESSLMIEVEPELFPIPPFLLATTISDYHCHIFDITDYTFLSPKDAPKFSDEIDQKLLMLKPSEALVERYKRSKAFLWERIDKTMTDRLQLVASEQDRPVIQKFEETIPEIRSILRSLPLSFVNNKLNVTSLLRTPENKIAGFHWLEWAIEPAGFGVDVQNENRTNLEEMIRSASEYRPELNQFPNESYELAALLSAFERYFYQYQYEDAIGLCHLILHNLNELKSTQKFNQHM